MNNKYLSIVIALCIVLGAGLAFGIAHYMDLIGEYSSTASLYCKEGTMVVPKDMEHPMKSVGIDDAMDILLSKETMDESGMRLLAAYLTNPSIADTHRGRLQRLIPDNVKQLAGETDSATYQNLMKNIDSLPFLIELKHVSKLPYFGGNDIARMLSVEQIGDGQMISLRYSSNIKAFSSKTIEIIANVAISKCAQLVDSRNKEVAVFCENKSQLYIRKLDSLDTKLSRITHKNRSFSSVEAFNRLRDEQLLLIVLSDSLNKCKAALSSLKSIEVRELQQHITATCKLASAAELNDAAKSRQTELQQWLRKLRSDLERAVIKENPEAPRSATRTYTHAFLNFETMLAMRNALIKLVNPASDNVNNGKTTAEKKLRSEIASVGELYTQTLKNIDDILNNRNDQTARSSLRMTAPPAEPSTNLHDMLIPPAAGAIFGLLIGIFIGIISRRGRTIRTVAQAERRTGLKVAGIWPSATAVRRLPNLDKTRNNLMYHLLRNVFHSAQQQRIAIASSQDTAAIDALTSEITTWLLRKGKTFRTVTPFFDHGNWLLSEGSGDLKKMHTDFSKFSKYDIIIFKLPSLQKNACPLEFVKQCQTMFVVCRANKRWMPSNKKELKRFILMTGSVPKTVLFDASLDVVKKFDMNQTYFASPNRTTPRRLNIEQRNFRKNSKAMEFVKDMPSLCVVLDKNRQVVYINENMMSMLGLTNINKAVGLRPGELVACIYSDMTPAGCGTSSACQSCGAVNTILRCMKTRKVEHGSCQINSFINDAMAHFRFTITCTPFEMGDDFYVIVNLVDIKGDETQVKHLLDITQQNPTTPEVGELEKLFIKAGADGQLDQLTQKLTANNPTLNDSLKAAQRRNEIEEETAEPEPEPETKPEPKPEPKPETPEPETVEVEEVIPEPVEKPETREPVPTAEKPTPKVHEPETPVAEVIEGSWEHPNPEQTQETAQTETQTPDEAEKPTEPIILSMADLMNRFAIYDRTRLENRRKRAFDEYDEIVY